MSHYFDELKAYLKFDAADHVALRQLLSVAKPYFSTITQDFYDRLQRQPSAMAVFRSDEQVVRLRGTLAKWMDRLLSGPWDEDYFELRSRIGKVHVHIALPQHHVFAAMAVIQEHLMGIAWENLDSSEAEAAVIALQKITNIDLAIMLASYNDDFVNQVRAYERSEKNLLENRLEKTQALYHSIFESSGVAIMITDGKYRIRLFNSMAENLTGYSRQEVAGCAFDTQLIHPNDRDEMRAMLSRVQEREECPPQELRMLTGDKSNKWIRWHLSPIKETDDLCILGVDVTRERKLAGKTRRVETLAALGTLAAGLAHEIRNPLNAAQLHVLLVERAIGGGGDAVVGRALESSRLVKAELTRLAGLV